MILSDLSEFRHRLGRASAGEIAHRTRRKLTAWQLKRALRRHRPLFKIPLIDAGHIASLELPGFELDADPELIPRLLRGETFTLHFGQADIQRFEAEHGHSFSTDIRLQPGDPDIRAVWEPARLQHAAWLLLHPESGPAERAVGAAAVLGWIRRNPLLRGPHYMSAMECGLRIPVFFYCLKNAETLSGGERSELLEAVYAHAWWIENNLSLHSSLGNHTVCECAGLVFGGALFRRTDAGERWMRMALKLLVQESRRQILDDGGPAEQSLAYHRFVLDLYALVIGFLERNRLFDCGGLKERVLAGERFLSAFAVSRVAMPSIGDSDDGHAVAPGIRPLTRALRPAEDLHRERFAHR
jgi:hypothetical protein